MILSKSAIIINEKAKFDLLLTSVTFTPHTTSYDGVPTFACQEKSNTDFVIRKYYIMKRRW